MSKWTKIGIREGDRLKLFTLNNELTNGNPVECGQTQPNSEYKPSYSVLNDPDYYARGYYFGNYYAVSIKVACLAISLAFSVLA